VAGWTFAVQFQDNEGLSPVGIVSFGTIEPRPIAWPISYRDAAQLDHGNGVTQ